MYIWSNRNCSFIIKKYQVFLICCDSLTCVLFQVGDCGSAYCLGEARYISDYNER